MGGKIISCCGVVCSECDAYPEECKGCPAIGGRVFWLQYTGGSICDIYQCCVKEKALSHCGQCAQLPCSRYDTQDPTKSQEENDAGFQRQMALLHSLGQCPLTNE